MKKIPTLEKMDHLGRWMQQHGESPRRVLIGEITGASFYNDETGKPRDTPRLYVDMDADLPVGHYRVYIVEVTAEEEGNTND